MGAVAASAAALRIVGKADLCAALGWSRPRLDRRLESDAAFPVKTRGDRSGGWEFDLDAIEDYLGVAADEVETEQEAEVVPLVRRGAVVHEGEATATQRLRTAQAQREEDRIRRERGELVEASVMKIALATAVTKLAMSLNALPDQLTRRLSLPESATEVIRQEVEEGRRGFYQELRQALGLDLGQLVDE